MSTTGRAFAGGDQVVGALEVVGRAHRRAEDRELLPPHAVQCRGRVRPGRGAADDDASFDARGVERSLPRRLADVVDDDVRAAARHVLDVCDDVVRLVIDRGVGAELARLLQLRRRSTT